MLCRVSYDTRWNWAPNGGLSRPGKVRIVRSKCTPFAPPALRFDSSCAISCRCSWTANVWGGGASLPMFATATPWKNERRDVCDANCLWPVECLLCVVVTYAAYVQVFSLPSLFSRCARKATASPLPPPPQQQQQPPQKQCWIPKVPKSHVALVPLVSTKRQQGKPFKCILGDMQLLEFATVTCLNHSSLALDNLLLI